MSDASSQSGGEHSGAGQEAILSALFAQLVSQQTNMAMMFLGKVAHPESGQPIKDLDAARLFIDELEMLSVKTKGNLTKNESALLNQHLMSLRLAFVQAVEEPAPASQTQAAQPKTASASEPARSAPAQTPAPASGETTSPAEEEHKKKFSKKY